MSKPAVVILGSTSSIARALALEFAREGHALILGALDQEESERIAADIGVRYEVPCAALPFDAANFESHPSFFETCAEKAEENLAGVVLCFGYMVEQELAQGDFAEAHRIMDINYTGTASILSHFANHFEARKEGFIAALSSVAGDRGRQSNYIYGSAKAGVSAFLQGLRNRLHKAGVPVTTIKPGFVDTQMTYGLPGLFLVASPEAAAKAIHRAIRKRRDTAYIPWFWRYIMLIIRTIPEWQFKKMGM
jgi:short-subunit dehydrogenase